MSTKCEGRFLVGVLVLCLAVWSAWQALGPTAGSASNGLTDDSDTTAKALPRRLAMTVQPFLERYCITCHGSKKPKASLDLSRQWTVADIAKDFAKWEIVLQRLQAEEMPPASAPRRPTVAELAAVTAWLRDLRDHEAERTAGDSGIVLARRLRNAEVDYTIRDLTGVDMRPTREFPVDPANQAGFDNSGESLTMSPTLMKKYLAAARHVADHVVLRPAGFVFAPHPAVTVVTAQVKVYLFKKETTMPGLTVTEKEHWKERVSRRIDKKIDAIAAEQPNLMDRVQRESREKALQSLGLAELQAEQDQLEEEGAKIKKRQDAIECAMLAKVRGVPVEDIEHHYRYGADTEVANAIQRRQKVHEDELFAQDPIGQQILALRAEKDELLDTVWLASSPKQIKELWTKVAELLGDEQTRLQKDALATAGTGLLPALPLPSLLSDSRAPRCTRSQEFGSCRSPPVRLLAGVVEPHTTRRPRTGTDCKHVLSEVLRHSRT